MSRRDRLSGYTHRHTSGVHDDLVVFTTVTVTVTEYLFLRHTHGHGHGHGIFILATYPEGI
jgi:hypothetical protein